MGRYGEIWGDMGRYAWLDAYEAEARAEAVLPLRRVEQRPDKVAAHGHALPHRAVDCLAGGRGAVTRRLRETERQRDTETQGGLPAGIA